MNRLLYLAPIAVFAILAVFFTMQLIQVQQGEDPRQLESVLINREVPPFSMEPLPGRGMGLSSEDLKGQVSLYNIFGSGCGACLAEHPFLIKIKENGWVPIHGIDWRDDPGEGYKWLMKHGDPYTRVGADPNSKVAIDFGVTGAPESFIVDKNGVVRYKHIGPIDQQVWDEILAPKIEALRAQ